MDVLPRLGPDLPDAGVRFTPRLRDAVGDLRNVLCGGVVDPVPARRREAPDRVEDVAVDVELHLIRSAVSDPDGTGGAVAVERLQLLLVGVVAAVDAVESLQARQRQPGRVHQPPEEGLGLVVVTEPQERADREARVA
jgi:hypothetical protein